MIARPRLVAVLALIALGFWAPGRPAAAQPGALAPIAFAHAATLGRTGVPWQRSNAYLNQPIGLAADRDGIWVANAAGRNALRFGTGPVEEIGRAGDPDAVYGRPIRRLADLAVSVPPAPPGQPPTATPTPDPAGGLTPPGPRVVWLVDQGAHAVLGIPLQPDGRTGTPIVLGEPDEAGADAEHFDGPTGVAVDARGNVFVSDTGNHRVQVFDPAGQPIAAIGQAGQPGAGDDRLNRPARLALGPDGRLYVADSGNHRVQAFDIADPHSPRLARSYGRSGQAGSAPDQLDTPLGLAVDATFLYVADTGNGRVSIIERGDGDPWRRLDGVAADACGAGDPRQRWTGVTDLALDAAGNLFVALPAQMRVASCGAFDRSQRTGYGGTAPYLTAGELYNAPAGLALLPDGSLRIAEAEGHRVIARPAAGGAAWTFGQPGLAGAGEDRLAGPADLIVLPDDRLVVADRDNGRLVVLDAGGAWQAAWDGGADPLTAPEGLALLADGRIAVADAGAGRVRLFDASGQPRGELGDPSGAPHAFESPADVAVDSRGRWYVSERGAHAVRVFDAQGRPLATLGQPGMAGDAFDRMREPRGLALDGADRLYVVDSGNHRVLVFGPEGDFLALVGGARGEGTGGLREPRGLALGADGRLYVADTYNHRIQVFAPALDPWAPAAANGFGRREHSAVEALTDFEGRLYAGLRAAEGGASLWRRQESGDWEEVASGGFGDAGNRAVISLARAGDQLYAGTEQIDTQRDPGSGQVTESSRGAEVWRSPDGAQWERVASGGFGKASNYAVGALAEYQGQVYAGTRGMAAAPELWRSAGGAAGSWQQVRMDLFSTGEWPKNAAISAILPYSGTLVLGTCGRDKPQVWTSADGARWRAAGFLAEGEDPRNAVPQLGSGGAACVTSLAEHEGRLYAGLGNDPDTVGRVWQRGAGAVELWRCVKCDGTDWEDVVATGFADPSNRGEVALAVFDEPPFRYLYALVGNAATGLQAWRAPEGLDWEPVMVGGFGDDNNRRLSGRALAVHRGRLYAGTANLAQGGELWSSAGTRPGTVPTPPGPTATPTPRPSPQPPTGRAAYHKVDEWPVAQPAPGDVLGAPVDLAIADDATVYILDSGPVRVARLLPDGTWGEPFGGTGSGPERVTEAGAIAVDSARGRLYVADLGTERVLVFDRDGRLLRSIPEVYGMDLEVQPAGSIWVADRLSGAALHLAADGREIERIGRYAPDAETGMITMVAVTETPSGRVWVADLDGQRVRAYERDGAGGFRRVRTVDLGLPGFARNGCSGNRLQALDDDTLLAGPCLLVDGRLAEGLPANHRGSDLYGVGLRTANPAAGLHFALATYDVDRDDPNNATFPAIVRYFDRGFDIVTDSWLGRPFDAAIADPDAVQNPVRLSALPGGELVLSDDLGLRRFAPDGRTVEVLPVESFPSRNTALEIDPRLVVATGEAGRVMGVARYRYLCRRCRMDLMVLVYGRGVNRRTCTDGECTRGIFLETLWDTTLVNNNQSRGAMDYNYAAAFEPTRAQYVLLQNYADNPSTLAYPSRLFLFPVGQQGRKTEILLEGTDREALWTDVDTGPDGRIYVLDTLLDRVQVLDAAGAKLGMVNTPKDAWRVAGGPNGEIFVLTTYGLVVRLAADGTELSRFLGMPNDFAPTTALADLAVDAWGRVYTIDALYDQVTVFEPEGREDAVLEGNRCSLGGDKWVAPKDILLGGTAELFLSLFGSCGFAEAPAEFVIAVNTKYPNSGANYDNLRVARHIMSLIDLDRHRLGLLGYTVNAEIQTGLTQDRLLLVRKLSNLTVGRPVPTCQESNIAAMKAAEEIFQDALPGRRKVLVIVQPADEMPRGECAWDIERTAEEAERLKAAGVVIVTVNAPSIAASSEVFSDIPMAPRGQGEARPALRRAMSRSWPDDLVRQGTLVDRLPANIDYVPGSARPPATWDPAARTLSWDLRNLARDTAHRFSLEIRPREEGLWPTNVEAQASGEDGWGNPFGLTLPVPRIRVYGEPPPTATRTPTRTPTPTATLTPSATPTATATRVPKPVYLPILLWNLPCAPETQSADYVLVTDTSTSMSEVTSPGGPTKMEAARAAARAFLGQLKPGRDQAALIQFNGTATVVEPLTEDPVRVVAALDRLTQAQGTRIDLGLDAALAELSGPDRRPDNSPVVILLTDGAPSAGATPETVRAAAARAQAAGLLVFTIGLGADVDGDLLRDVATRPEWYYPAPDTADLAAIYARIAVEIPCRPDWP